MPRPDLDKTPVFYHGYINHVAEDDLHTAFTNSTNAFLTFLEELPAGKIDYRYAPGKWSIKEVLQHVIDSERIFTYRALRFARRDQTPLPGFEENDYAANAKTDNRQWNDLVEEFKAVRQSTTYFFTSLDEEQLNNYGSANGNPVSVLAIGFLLVGHVLHHTRIIKERYLTDNDN